MRRDETAVWAAQARWTAVTRPTPWQRCVTNHSTVPSSRVRRALRDTRASGTPISKSPVNMCPMFPDPAADQPAIGYARVAVAPNTSACSEVDSPAVHASADSYT